MIGQTISHYRIVEKIGEGGMGEVYRARDERLDRDVAIKVLPESVAQDTGRLVRFEREAKAVARLAHPNILEIYELGDHEGRPFMATELLRGETVRERLAAGGLGWRKATEIAAAIADALGVAHEAGIVHRDLKPSNVFLTADGRVKVLDFGLARHEDANAGKEFTKAPTLTRHTDPGTVLGTVGYMSPEQVRGESVDHRSDVFSLGCVLYEMVSGRRAFTGDSAVETMNAILKQEPSDILVSGVELPAELAGTIRRCLEKKPQSRFQSASDLAYNLRTISSASVASVARDRPRRTRREKGTWWIAIAAVAVIMVGVAVVRFLPRDRHQEAEQSAMGVTLQWVAVAPLENRTGDASLDPLGQRAVDLIAQRFSEVGMADAVLTMDAVPYPAGSVTKKRSPPNAATPPRGGKGQHVLLSGAYYQDVDALEFQARLTDYDTGELVYAFKPISATRSQPADALNDLRERVVAAVAFHRSTEYDVRLMAPPSTYASFRAFDHGWRAFGSVFEESLAAFQKVLELDPDLPFARMMVATSYMVLGDRAQAAREISSAESRRDRFTEFEQMHLSLTAARLKIAPLEELAYGRELVRLAPHIPWTRQDAAGAAMYLNRPQEVVDLIGPILPTHLAESHPMAWWNLNRALGAYHGLREYEEALRWAEIGLEIFPDVGDFFFHKAAALAALGRLEDVDRVVDECTRVQLREAEVTMDATEVMAWVASELRVHGHAVESHELAVRAVEWYEGLPEERTVGLPDARALWRRFVYSYALRAAGRWDESKAALVELEDRGWSPIVVAGARGVIAARSGDHDEAQRIVDDFPDPGPPFNPGWRCFWRGCIASQLGEKARAVELIEEGLVRGLRHNPLWHRLIDLEPLWDYPPFQELMEPKG